MVCHIVLWNFKQELSKEAQDEAARTIRNSLEAVREQTDGVVSLEVIRNELDSSSKDLGLIASFASVEALHAYQVHPAHVQAGAYIKTVTCDRVCLDYEV